MSYITLTPRLWNFLGRNGVSLVGERSLRGGKFGPSLGGKATRVSTLTLRNESTNEVASKQNGGTELGRIRCQQNTVFHTQNITYDHRHWKARDPVRSPIDKPVTARLVVGWVTTSESLVLYVIPPPFCFFWNKHKNGWWCLVVLACRWGVVVFCA
ncbi:hypothetical protein B0H63DRAFT_472641 [Podospora didyma]|uniref:Uncharacterized protein n=1 Tax=Podospora didyma TaxID=330526 RepID=A0AAE0NPQ1_9PEZI|nr:hypothetical protein B0H63DRAFT_472641 [Podospora didyma]